MPDKRQHRGAHPEDQRLFAPAAWPRLRAAVDDFSWLLGRDYATNPALKLVGDRYQLAERQRLAVMRCSCSDASREYRRQRQINCEQMAGQTLWIDGYNVLTTIEVALSGAVVLAGRDGCYRDIASMHGTFRKVEETLPAITLIGDLLTSLNVHDCVWYLDSPVSNSGRLKGMILEVGAARNTTQSGGNWQVEVVTNPDPILAKTTSIIATADSVILDQCQQWFNLAREVITQSVSESWLLDLSHGLYEPAE